MADSNKPVYLTGQELIDFLKDAIAKAERGELDPVAFRAHLADGTWEDQALGFESEEEQDAALAKLKRMLGGLH